jgi:Winged helix DNA-binding domain
MTRTWRIGADGRRARLAARHHLAPAGRTAPLPDVVADLIALHGTDPASVYLAAWARRDKLATGDVDDALYEQGTLVRMLGMRRTIFVVPAGLVPVVQAACTDQVAERMGRALTGVIEEAGVARDADGWLRDVAASVLASLAARGPATGQELAAAEPRLRMRIVVAEGKSYGGPVNLTSRVLNLMSAQGLIVRGRPRGGWTSTRYEWMAAPEREPLPAAQARAELARRWLLAFGPAPVSDLQWWAGWTAGQTKAAVAQLDLVDVDLDGLPGTMLAGDDPGSMPDEPWAALLPALDPTAMGWQDRDWFLGGHARSLFDRSGNIGPTIWWQGRVVGGWAQRGADGEIATRLGEDIGTDGANAVAGEAVRLFEWLGAARVTPRFRTPLERELSA